MLYTDLNEVDINSALQHYLTSAVCFWSFWDVFLWDAIEMQTSNNALTSIVKTVCAVDGLCTDYNLCCKCNKIYAEGIHKFGTK